MSCEIISHWRCWERTSTGVSKPLGTGANTSGAGSIGASMGGGAAKGAPRRAPGPGAIASSMPGISPSGNMTRLMTCSVPRQLATSATTTLATGVASWSDSLTQRPEFVSFVAVKTIVFPFSDFFLISRIAVAWTSFTSVATSQVPEKAWLPSTCKQCRVLEPSNARLDMPECCVTLDMRLTLSNNKSECKVQFPFPDRHRHVHCSNYSLKKAHPPEDISICDPARKRGTESTVTG